MKISSIIIIMIFSCYKLSAQNEIDLFQFNGVNNEAVVTQAGNNNNLPAVQKTEAGENKLFIQQNNISEKNVIYLNQVSLLNNTAAIWQHGDNELKVDQVSLSGSNSIVAVQSGSMKADILQVAEENTSINIFQSGGKDNIISINQKVKSAIVEINQIGSDNFIKQDICGNNSYSKVKQLGDANITIQSLNNYHADFIEFEVSQTGNNNSAEQTLESQSVFIRKLKIDQTGNGNSAVQNMHVNANSSYIIQNGNYNSARIR
jgi:hypothetical protein